MSDEGTPPIGRAGEPALAVERAIELLLAVLARPASTSLHELTDRVGYSKSTTHRLLARLEKTGVIERDSESRRYRTGQRLRDTFRENAAELDRRRVALPFMERLRDVSGETVSLHLLDGTEEVVIERCEGRQELRHVVEIGRRRPLRRGATARALLAFMPPARAAAALRQGGVDLSTADLEAVRARGYATSMAELVPGVVALSTPVFDDVGRVWAGLSLSGPAFRFTPEQTEQHARALVDAAGQLSRALGSSSPAPSLKTQESSGVHREAAAQR